MCGTSKIWKKEGAIAGTACELIWPEVKVEKLGFKLESSYKIETDTKKIYIKC